MVYAEQGAFLRPNPASEVEALPWGGDIDDEGPRPDPFGQSYIQIDADALTDDAPDLEVSFYGDPERRWYAALVVEDFDQIDEVVELELVDGEGVGQLRQLTDDDYIWLVATPLDGEEGGHFRYAVTAVDLPEEDTGAGEAKGCSTRPGGAGLLGALALAAALAVRRRG
jgi:MYXO-CTERM domain-containing protein